jgi:hypothetical protein
MNISETVDRLENEFLRIVYELAERRAKHPVPFAEAQMRSGRSETEADRACDYWADRGIIEFPSLHHIALTHLGLRRAQRLAQRGWRPHMPF